MPSGPYVVLPLLGPSTVRDTVGWAVDAQAHPIGYMNRVAARNALSGLEVINARAQMLQASDLLDQAALDPYVLMRDAYLQQRDARAGQAAVHDGAEANPAEDGYEPPLQDEGAATGTEQQRPATASRVETAEAVQTGASVAPAAAGSQALTSSWDVSPIPLNEPFNEIDLLVRLAPCACKSIAGRTAPTSKERDKKPCFLSYSGCCMSYLRIWEIAH